MSKLAMEQVPTPRSNRTRVQGTSTDPSLETGDRDDDKKEHRDEHHL